MATTLKDFPGRLPPVPPATAKPTRDLAPEVGEYPGAPGASDRATILLAGDRENDGYPGSGMPGQPIARQVYDASGRRRVSKAG